MLMITTYVIKRSKGKHIADEPVDGEAETGQDGIALETVR